MVLALSLLLTGCVAQSEYDAVVTELDAAQSQIATLQSDYAAAQSEIEGLEGELSTAQGNFDALNQSVAKAKLYGEILENYYFMTAFEMTTAEMIELSSIVDDTGDAELKEKWTTYLDTLTEESRIAFWIAVWDGLWEALH